MKTVVTSASGFDTISLADAKKHLKVYHDGFDRDVESALWAAIDWAEKFTSRTLRTTVGRTANLKCWEDLHGARLPWQPVIALSAVTYIDTAGDEQTVSASNYRLVRSTELGTSIELDVNYTRPTLADRGDAVRVAYTTGYAEVADVPHLAVQAIKMMLSVFYMDMTANEVKVWSERAEACLNQIDWSWL